jgi:hypothetical protein
VSTIKIKTCDGHLKRSACGLIINDTFYEFDIQIVSGRPKCKSQQQLSEVSGLCKKKKSTLNENGKYEVIKKYPL